MRACASAWVLPSRSIRRCNCTHCKQGVCAQDGNASNSCEKMEGQSRRVSLCRTDVFCPMFSSLLCGACPDLHCW
jgi:hypothetical protein